MKNKLCLIGFLTVSFLFMEGLIRIFIGISLLNGLLLPSIYLFSFSFFLVLLSSLFKEKINFIILVFFLSLSSTLYTSQFIYFDFFKTFYSLYSLANGTQIIEFWREISATVIKDLIWIILLSLPIIFLMFFRRKIAAFHKTNYLTLVIFLLGGLFLQGIGHLIIYRDLNSPSNFFYSDPSPIQSVKSYGLLTTIEFDLKRQFVGLSPTVEVVAASTINIEENNQDQLLNKETAKENQETKGKQPEYNQMDINFDGLIGSDQNKSLKQMDEYFKMIKPTAKNDFTGMYKGFNLILITAESFSPYAVNKDITPTLYKLVNEGYKFTNFYNPLWDVSTSDGEYVALNGLIPKTGVWSFYKAGKNALPFVMGNQLKKLSYKTLAYHDHSYTYYRRDISHPNMGYDYKGVGNGLIVKKTWPESDLEMIEKTVPEYINEDLFHVYYMTVSGHLEYNFSGNAIAIKNRKEVENLDCSDQAKAYIAGEIELDRALELLIKKLDEANVMNHSLIVLSADHYPYGLDDKTISEFLKHPVEKNFELYKSNLIIYTSNMNPVTVNKPVSSLDILPTISNLLGLEYDSRLLMGHDIFSNDPPLVIFRNHSFITDKGKYNAVTKSFLPNEGEKVTQEYIDKILFDINQKFYYSAKIIEIDYFRHLFPD